MLREELDRLIINMLDGIYKEHNDPVTEINFTINCLESVLDREFSPEETVKLFSILSGIVNKAGNNK